MRLITIVKSKHVDGFLRLLLLLLICLCWQMLVLTVSFLLHPRLAGVSDYNMPFLTGATPSLDISARPLHYRFEIRVQWDEPFTCHFSLNVQG